MMYLNFLLNNCMYRILQCEGKETQIYIYLCDTISVSVIKCVVCKELEVVVTAGRNIFFCMRTGIVIDCFIVRDVESQTHNS
jgi:hypothetical protein